MAKNSLSYHDRFTRSLMTNPKVIQEFFHKNLPAHVREAVDLSSIQLQRETHINEQLKTQIVDLLYKADFNGKPGFLYLMIEHASKSHPLLPFRILKYMTGVMEDHLKTVKEKELPLVYPLIFYTGKRPYAHTLDLFDLFPEKDRELARQTLFSPYHLIDLTQNSDEELREFLWYGPMARVLKHIHDVNILPSFKDLLPELKVIEAYGEVGYIHSVLTYVVGLAQTPHQEDLYETIKELGTVNEEKLMTLADYLKPKVYNRGIEHGKVEGIIESKTDIARNMLAKGMDIDLIASVTELSSQEVKRLAH